MNIKIILLQDVPKLGKKFETKNVSAGYAKNFLFPKHLAVSADKSHLAKINQAKQARKDELQQEEKSFTAFEKTLIDKTIILKARANKKGGLFATVSEKEIRSVLEKTTKYKLPKNANISFSKPIKQLGEHTAFLVWQNKKIPLKIEVIKEEE